MLFERTFILTARQKIKGIGYRSKPNYLSKILK